MKKKNAVIAFLLIGMMLLSAGCGKSSSDIPANLPAESVEEKEPGGKESGKYAQNTDRDPGEAAGISREASGTDRDNAEKRDTEKEETNEMEASEKKASEKKASDKKASDKKISDKKISDKKTVRDVYHTGDSLSDGPLRIIYMASGIYREENEYLQPEEGMRYIFLQFCFENTAAEQDISIPVFRFVCFADGYEAGAYYGGRNEPAASISAGRTAVGTLCFQVPEKAEKIEIEYMPRYLSAEVLPSSGKVCFLYEGEQDSGCEIPSSTERSPQACAVGGTAETGAERLTFVSCEPDDPDNENLEPQAGCSYCTLTFEIENTGTDDSGGDELRVSAYDFSCYADGTACRATFFRDDYLSASIPAGRRARGTVTFEIPDSAQTVEAEYDSAAAGGKHVVFTVR